MIHLNKKKEAVWGQMTPEQKLEYQTDNVAREVDGNKRFDFRFAGENLPTIFGYRLLRVRCGKDFQLKYVTTMFKLLVG